MNQAPIQKIVDDDGPVNESAFYSAAIVLITPFIVIPLSIIVYRLIRYLWMKNQARKYGYGDDVFEDPLAELGINLKRGYDNTAEIRKIRKEQRRMLQEIEKLNQKTEASKPETSNVFLKPIYAAESGVSWITRETKKTWSHKLSPSAVRKWVAVSPLSRAWMLFQVFITILAIINYVSLTYLVNKDEALQRRTIKDLDLFYGIMFLFDYILSFYIAEDRLKFYFHPMSLVDLISIVSPFVYVFVNTPNKYVWFVGLIRIFRATRILRTYRLLSFSQSEETREIVTFALNFLNFIFFSASIINACETLVEVWSAPASLKNWHDSLYYIMVTFSTIGFGDLTPTSTISRIIVMGLIILVILYIPYQTGKILDMYKSLNQYQRAQYSASLSSSHVIVGGDVTYGNLIDFCREYFIADSNGQLVVLNSDSPDLPMKRLLNHPFYRNRICYLQGSIGEKSDLKRASAHHATALFLLTKSSSKEEDANVLIESLITKISFPGILIFTQINDSRTKGLSTHCGCDRVVCIEELNAKLKAANCMVPGVQALIPNLVHSYSDANEIENSEYWMKEYKEGLSNQIYSFKVPVGMIGVRFSDAIVQIYKDFETLIFGLISVNSGFNNNPIRVGLESNYRLKNDDVILCITNRGEECMLRISIFYKDSNSKLAFAQKEIEESIEKSGPICTKFTSVELLAPNTEFVNVPLGSIPVDLTGHIILCGPTNPRIVYEFIQSLRARKTRAHPILCILESNIGEEWKDIYALGGVYFYSTNLIEKQTLNDSLIEKCFKIVIFSPENQKCQNDSKAIYLVKMIQQEWPTVNYMVELIDGSNVKYINQKSIEWNTNNLRVQSILNNYALGTNDRMELYRKIRSEGIEKETFLYHLVQLLVGPEKKGKKQSQSYSPIESSPTEPTESTKEEPLTEAYLNRLLEEQELNESGLTPYPVYHFDKSFAAGKVSTSSFMQTLICQTLFRPYINELVMLLCDRLNQLVIPEEFADQPYGNLVESLVKNNYIPLGLYRRGNGTHYVYTNCKKQDICTKDDLVFVIEALDTK